MAILIGWAPGRCSGWPGKRACWRDRGAHRGGARAPAPRDRPCRPPLSAGRGRGPRSGDDLALVLVSDQAGGGGLPRDRRTSTTGRPPRPGRPRLRARADRRTCPPAGARHRGRQPALARRDRRLHARSRHREATSGSPATSPPWPRHWTPNRCWSSRATVAPADPGVTPLPVDTSAFPTITCNTRSPGFRWPRSGLS
jgi:hypothetical protein